VWIFAARQKRIRAQVDFARRFASVRFVMAKKPFSRLIKILSGVHIGAENELGRLERFAHFCVLVGKSFVRNRCLIRASALSYTTLLAMIPLLAVAVSVTSSLLKTQGETQIYTAIDKVVSNIMPPATVGTNSSGVALNLSPAISVALTPANSIADTNSIASVTNNPVGGAPVVSINAQKEVAKDIHDFVQNTQKSGALGAVGMLLLVFVAIRMLANIEATFNDIWGVTRGRNWLWRIVLYWTTITLGPLAIIGALGLASGPHFQTVKTLLGHTPFIGGLFFEFLPLVVLWFAFGLLYQLVPNTKVHFSAALVGGIVAGSLWHLNNMFGFLYVSRVVTNSKIYGSLGLVPVFMIGLYFSWAILLFGAQVAYAFQNRKAYLQEKLVENVNQRGREFIALRLMTLVGGRFQRGEPAVTLQQISSAFGIPGKIVQDILQPLLAAKLVTEIAGAETAYTPARPLDAISAHDVLRAVRNNGQELATRDEPARTEVFGEFARIEEAERAAASSVTMLALVNRAPAQLEIGDRANSKK
jgi:membrane protein